MQATDIKIHRDPFLQAIARAVQAYANCQKSGNPYQSSWDTAIQRWSDDLLPRGSGIDDGSYIDVDTSKPNRIVICTSFHPMDDNGCYAGWINGIKVIVTPDLCFDFEVNVTGPFGKHQDLKDYLHEVFSNALRKTLVATYEAEDGGMRLRGERLE